MGDRNLNQQAWVCLMALVGSFLGQTPVWGQVSMPMTCDPSVLPITPKQLPQAVPSSDSANPVDLGSLPDADTKASALGPLEQLTPPSTSLDVPKTPSEVAIAKTQAITRTQAIELARRRNRDLEIARLQVEQQQSALREARAAIYPTVGTQASITRSDSAQAAILAKQAGRPNRPNASNNFSGSVNLNYDVFTSGQRTASIRAAEAALSSAQQAYQTQFEQLRLDVANDYYDLQQADELVRIARQTVENAAENLRVTKAKEAAGLGTRFEVLQADVLLADRKQQLIQAESQQQVARRNLAQRLSLPATATFTAADPVAMAGEWSPSLEESIVQALQSRTELAQVLDQRTIAQQNRRVALGSLGPQLTFSANITLADALDDSNLGAYGYGLGAEASKTIFDGGSAKAIAAQQDANRAIAETQFDGFKNLIRFQVEQNYYLLKSSRERILTTRCAIQQAQQGLNLAKLRRDYGVGTSLEVSNATTDLAQAENNYLSAIVDYNRALAALQRFVVQR